ncbi:MAG: hypothetical protein IIC00_12395 [Planctomycetes bacterium]|nr:hypothetical protein [Planctomycetota bacterium]
MEDNLFTSPNSIIYHNSVNPRIQIESDSATVTYTDVQGGWLGERGPPLEKKTDIFHFHCNLECVIK